MTLNVNKIIFNGVKLRSSNNEKILGVSTHKMVHFDVHVELMC